MVSEVETVKLLPLERSAFGEDSIPANLRREAIQLYPSVESVMDNIVPNYVTGMIYGCLVEAYASEHNARMTAMKSATDSAEAIIKDLSIAYNRARRSMTLIPVSRISTAGLCSSNVGACLWISQRSASFSISLQVSESVPVKEMTSGQR